MKSKGEPRVGLRAFLSYSHRDEKLRKQLETHLMLLQHQRVIVSWHDRLIGAGLEWKDQISRSLEQADLILLLISADFIASEFCWGIELTHALERHEASTARVIPIIVRDVDWCDAPFAKLQVLPRDGKAITLWSHRDSAWRNVVKGIKAAAEEMLVSLK